MKQVETFRTIYQAKVVIIGSGGKPRLTGAKKTRTYIFMTKEFLSVHL